MKTKSVRTFLSMLGLLALTSALVAGEGDHAAKAKIGEAAPNFTLKDAAGKSYSLADYKGKTVVLQWINPDCPVCKNVMAKGVTKNTLQELKAIDANVVYLAINSTWNMEGAKTAAYLKHNKIEVPGLIDQEGTVGHLYGAKTTPHLFVIDKTGVLRYEGALDDDSQQAKGKDATNYVVNAVRQLNAGETVSPDQMKSYGCSVKYKPTEPAVTTPAPAPGTNKPK